MSSNANMLHIICSKLTIPDLGPRLLDDSDQVAVKGCDLKALGVPPPFLCRTLSGGGSSPPHPASPGSGHVGTP